VEDKKLTIKDAAKILGIKEPTMRKYEQDFNLKIPRNEVGHRYFTDKEIALFKQIKALKDKGANTNVIKNILERSVTAEEQKETALELVTIDKLTGAELKELMLKQISDIMIERERLLHEKYEEKIESIKYDFEKSVALEFEKQKEDICNHVVQQVKTENQKLMDYVTNVREDEKKKSFWSKIFGK